LQELLNIYTGISECRRKAKDYDKHIQTIAKRDPSTGMFPLGASNNNATRIPDGVKN
jgi:hypothetical protein